MRVYIVDNTDTDAEIIERRLLSLPNVKSIVGYYGFDTAQTVLASYYEDDVVAYPDLVVMEAKLNNGSATDLIRLIRACKGMSSIPVLIYTSSSDVELKRACSVAGATQVFSKSTGGDGIDAMVAYVASFTLKAK